MRTLHNALAILFIAIGYVFLLLGFLTADPPLMLVGIAMAAIATWRLCHTIGD